MTGQHMPKQKETDESIPKKASEDEQKAGTQVEQDDSVTKKEGTDTSKSLL